MTHQRTVNEVWMAGDGDVHPPSPYSDCSLWTSLFTTALSSDGVTWGPGGGGAGCRWSSETEQEAIKDSQMQGTKLPR